MRTSININDDIWKEFEEARKKTGKSKNELIKDYIVFSLHWSLAEETVFQTKYGKKLGKLLKIYQKVINKPRIQKQIWDKVSLELSEDEIQELTAQEGIFDKRSKKLLKKPKRGRRVTNKKRKGPGHPKKSDIYN